MLSASQLERASFSYRQGYKDGYWRRVKGVIASGLFSDFAKYDYENGYDAGANDAYWCAVRNNEPLPLAPVAWN